MTVETPQMKRDRILLDIENFLQENGEGEEEGYTIGKTRYGVVSLEPLRVGWGYPGETGRWINSLVIDYENEMVEYTQSGGSHYEEEYKSPQQVIDMLSDGAKTTRNYPT